MKPLVAIFLAALMAGAGVFSADAAAAKPNVIVILTDDQGSVDAGCYGAKDLATPVIDSLAARGVRFTQFYSASPVCSPSRAGLLTGRYPLRCGVPGNCASQRDGKGALPAGEVTMAETFKAAGYATAHVGKWHLGYTPETMPNAQGFDYSFGHMGGCIDNWSHFFYWQGPNIHDLHRNGTEVFADGRFFGSLMVEEASKFMAANRERPFFIYFAINEPHYPYQPNVKWSERLKHLPYPRNLYAAFLATMDERIGDLLRCVDDLKLRERTIVVFQSDNGHSTEERAHFGGGSAGPYRGAKFSLFEGGIRLPAILSWPGHLPEGAVRGQVAHGCDWLPTVAELAGVKLLQPAIDGRSLVPVLKSADAPSPHDVLHWHVGDGRNPQWAVREGDWKLIGNAWDSAAGVAWGVPGGDKKTQRFPLFLSNLVEDVGEKKNFAAEQPEIAERLRKLHDDWVRQCENQKANGQKP
ncbi:MAG: sulfatase-like hydrolase/transferase [Verrucomicrobia bacterium]|nr:sulfatase-like hydrolase/transferase [Verrucomicrobiota bacterium]